MRHFLRTAVWVVSSAIVPSVLSALDTLLCADNFHGDLSHTIAFLQIIYNMIQRFFLFVNTFFHICIDKFKKMRYSINVLY